MADNFAFTAGVGSVGASDDVGGVHYPKVKLVDGTADSSTIIAVDVGVKANALRVAPANDITDGTYIGDIKFGEAEPNSAAILADTTAILADTAAIQTAVELLDNAVDGNYLNVNLNAAGTDLSMNAGVLTAQTMRVTIATDDEVNNLLGTIDADTSSIATDAGTIAGDTTSIDGKITACNTGAVVLAASDGTDIGDVDVASVVPGTGATNLGKAEDAAHSSGDVGVMVLAVRQSAQADFGADGDYVPMSIDDNGALRVSGGGGGTEYTEDAAAPANPVGGALMAERDDALGGLTPAAGDWSHLFCDANGALWTHDDALDACVSGSELQVDIVADGAGLATDAKLDTIITALQIMDDWDDANFANVNCNIAGTDIVGGAGAVAAGVQRVTLASDDPAVVDLAAIEVLLGTMDADTSLIAANTTATNVALAVLTDWDDGDYCNVNMNLAGTDAQAGEGVITASTQRVTLATDDDGVAHLATIAGDTTAIQTAIEIIDDWDAVHDSAASSDGPQLMAAYDSTKPTAVADGDAVRVLADASGRLLTGVEPERFQATITSADATSATAVKAKTASRQIHVLSLIISTDTAMNIQLQDDAGTPVVLMEQIYLAANGGIALQFPPEAPLVVATNQDLDVIASASGNISVTVTGYLMP